MESDTEGSLSILREASLIPECHSTFGGGLFLALAAGDGRMYGAEPFLHSMGAAFGGELGVRGFGGGLFLALAAGDGRMYGAEPFLFAWETVFPAPEMDDQPPTLAICAELNRETAGGRGRKWTASRKWAELPSVGLTHQLRKLRMAVAVAAFGCLRLTTAYS